MTVTLELLFPHLDELIQTPADLQRLNEAILQLAVQGKLVPQDPHDEPAGELLKRIVVEKARLVAEGKIGKEKPLPPIDEDEMPFALPMGWDWARTLTVCQSINDGDHQPPPKSESGVPFLVISNIRSGRLDFSNTRFVSEEYYDTIQNVRKPRRGDILYSIVGSLGTSVLIEDDIKFCFQRHMALFRPNETVNPEFLYYLLQSPMVLKQARECATGIAQLTIPMAGLRKILIPLPPLAEQKRIVAKVDELLARCAALESKLGQAQVAGRQLTAAVLHGTVG